MEMMMGGEYGMYDDEENDYGSTSFVHSFNGLHSSVLQMLKDIKYDLNSVSGNGASLTELTSRSYTVAAMRLCASMKSFFKGSWELPAHCTAATHHKADAEAEQKHAEIILLMQVRKREREQGASV